MARGGNLVSTSGSRPAQALTRRQRWDPALSLHSDIDRALDDFWRTFDFPLARLMTAPLPDVAVPRVNIRDTDKAVEITVEVPGVDQEDIDISIENGALTIRAEAQEERESSDERYSMREVGLARFERTIPIPEGLDIDNATAALRNGMLTISIPKSAGSQTSPRRIDVSSSGSSSSGSSGSSSSSDASSSSSSGT
jgi:HSP20 family protein